MNRADGIESPGRQTSHALLLQRFEPQYPGAPNAEQVLKNIHEKTSAYFGTQGSSYYVSSKGGNGLEMLNELWIAINKYYGIEKE